jgi:hypothetical protein
MEALREDFHALPGVLALPAPGPAGPLEPEPETLEPVPAPPAPIAVAEPVAEQLGLF